MDHHQAIISLYKEEISTYQQQIADLKKRNRDCDQKNAALIQKVQNLEDLVEKANVANTDLNVALEHIHSENVRLQANSNSQETLSLINHKQVTGANRKEELAGDSLVWMSEREQFKQRNKFLEREVQRYHRDNTHLGKQVRHLLKTLEEERGMIIRRQSQITEDNQLVCAADVIDKHLLTFESIEELQQQNQKLLSLVKDLSAEKEEREIRVESEEVTKLTTNLEELKSQLDTIKSDRERVLNTLKTIHRERDLFKILLCNTRQVEHLTPEIFQRMVSVACSAGPAIAGPDTSSTERESHIEDLKRMISNLEHNVETVKKELTDSQSDFTAELSLKNQLLEKAHLKISEVMKTLESANERNEVLETNIKTLTAEFDDLRTKCQKMTLELEISSKKLDESGDKYKEILGLLDLEKKKTQDALIEASRFKEQNHFMSESIEREKIARQQELASLFQKFERYTKNQVDLQLQLSNTEAKFSQMQSLRNFERERRIELDRLVYAKRHDSNGGRGRVKREPHLQNPELQPQQPQPTQPQPPQPQAPQPQLQQPQLRQPQPRQPQMRQPQPQQPQLQQPQPQQPEPQQPEPQQPEPRQPQLRQPQPPQPEPQQPEPQQPEPQQPGLQQPEAQQPEPQQPEAQQQEPQQPEAQQQEPQQTELQQPEPRQPQLRQPQPPQPEPQQPEPQQPEPQQPGLQQPEAQQPEPQQPEAQQQEPHQPEAQQPEPQQTTFIVLKRRKLD